ncbi:MAG: flagellin [Puniceicoccaceae bacterium]|nr:MAG: flagellin [Puniceicoccaceae bacterium]
MIINTNVNAINSARNLNQSQEMLSRSLSRLSSGTKIVQPSDDAAGLAVSEKMVAQNARNLAARTNVQNAISFVQTADGMMRSMTQVLTRMSELTALAKDVTKNSQDVALYNVEFQALREQLAITIGGDYRDSDGAVQSVASPLGSFNGISLFGPNPGGLQVIIGEQANQTMQINEINLRDGAGALNDLLMRDPPVGVNTTDALATVTDAIQQLATERATLGAAQSRLEIAGAQLQVQFENLEAAISRIRDVDVAEESTRLAKYNVLVQSGTSMLTQANALPQNVLRLLQ